MAAIGAASQVLFGLWINLAFVLLLSAAAVMLHVGSFAAAHLRAATVGALAISGLLFSTWAIASIAQRQVAGSRSLVLRYPTTATSALMLSLLGLSVALSWYREHQGGRLLVTTIALAAAYYFALIGLAFLVRATALAWGEIERWAAKSAYRMGVATALLLVIGLTGVFLRPASLQRYSESTVRRWLDVEHLEGSATAIELERALLCGAAAKHSRTLTTSAVPAGCESAME